ncbi:MAG: HEPN domain-containing protein [Candidatus Poribacteria bacterium]|nr:HEPN domain-containing protein [Candidatus Poribacteria bacterium]
MSENAARKWLRQALHDLEMAEKNIPIGGYDIAAFLSHQAVEKLLKAIYLIRGERVPKSHYIDEMAKVLGLDEELRRVIGTLTVDYTVARYPDATDRAPFEEYDEERAIGKVAVANQVFQALSATYVSLLESPK